MTIKTVDQTFINNLLEVAEEIGLEFDMFEGSLLDNYVFYTNKSIRVGGRSTKYVIIKEVSLGDWSSDYQLILTDSDKKANAFIEMFSQDDKVDLEENEVTEIITEVAPENELVSEWYTRNYPSDIYGTEINNTVTFKDLFETMDNYKDVYKVLETNESYIRERVFVRLTEIMKVDYDYIYEQWIKSAS